MQVASLSQTTRPSQALGATAADRGLYTVTGLSYAITDSVANLVAGLAGIDNAGISAATSINTNFTAAFTVAQATTWTSLANKVGHDHDADAQLQRDIMWRIPILMLWRLIPLLSTVLQRLLRTALMVTTR